MTTVFLDQNWQEIPAQRSISADTFSQGLIRFSFNVSGLNSVSLKDSYFLIKSYGLEGLAFSNLIALTLYNSVRFGFLYKKFNLQPYTWRHGFFLLSSITLMLLINMLPIANNFVANILIQSFSFGISFYVLAYWINPAPEILNFFNDFIQNKIPAFFKIKDKS